MKNTKGIILAGGLGSRLYPLTKSISKQMLPVYDKPMIYYPLSTLMLAGINEILIISSESHIDLYKNLFGNGQDIGLDISYKIQKKPNGIAEAFILGADFIGDDNVALILGDNIFYGENFSEKLKNALLKTNGATIFSYHVHNPENFGVIEFDSNHNVSKILEKPITFVSNQAITGLYFYDNEIIEIAKSLKPSNRGELEISDVNQIYLENNKLKVVPLGRGFAWLDAGTHDSYLEASYFIKTIEDRQGLKIGCLEEISFNMGWISKEELKDLSKRYSKTSYGDYLHKLLSHGY
jgi:glucose-1-phosphate thymidylyltransferase